MKALKYLSLSLFISLSGALLNEQSPPAETSNNNGAGHRILSWDTMTFAVPTVTSWKQEHERNLKTEPDNVFPGEDLIVTVSFQDIYKVILFMAVAWLLGSLSAFAGLPSLVGEIVAGFLLGPPLADFVPYPGALVLLGNIGLIGLILESGISLDLSQLKENGHRALLMATVGAALPLVAGFSVGRWIGQEVPSAIAAGACFASTSLGVASNALNTGDVINTPLGQLIVTSSVFDDVFGLILLSILQVIADPESQAFDYVLPFLSSFGYILVLGLLGITVLPRIIEEKILPLAPETIRDQVAMVLLLLFVTAYMLLLNESKASYLTGVFLAGLTFCKIRSVHAFFVKHAHPIHVWLLRVFFSATIGFQVPITRFQDPYVLKWGSAFLFATFAKIPIGFMAPRHKNREIPTDFPYNPYYRDVIVTSLSMACRGEFNVIVAAYALSQGLFVPDVYSAVMFAIMCGSIIAPLVLTKVLKYYNRLSAGYLKESIVLSASEIRMTDTVHSFWRSNLEHPFTGICTSFQKTLEEMGLVIIDHRSWHTLDRTEQSAVDITELFVQDTKMKVRIKHVFGKSTDSERLENGNLKSTATKSGGVDQSLSDKPSTEDEESMSVDGLGEERDIEERCLEIKHALSLIFKEYNPDDYAIQVSQWMAFVVDSTAPNSERSYVNEEIDKASNRDRFYSFQAHSFDAVPDPKRDRESVDHNIDFDDSLDDAKTSRQSAFRRSSTIGSTGDSQLTETRPALALHDFRDGRRFFALDCNGTGDRILVGGGLRQSVGEDTPRRHRRAVTFDASQLAVAELDRETEVFHERLHGYVRQTSLQSPPPAP